MTQSELYRLTLAQVQDQFCTDLTRGLSEAEAQKRLAHYGPNQMIDQGLKSPWRILWEQFTATMVLILLVAAGVSAFLAKWTETSAILGIVLLFGILGFLQEYRAEKALAALKKLAVPSVRVLREGLLRELPASQLTPGDIVLLEAGNLVPADLRLVESINLRIQEAALTGESEPVEKLTDQIDQPDLPLGDRRNMGYMGTVVTYGRGKGIVIATGMQTELGRIATLMQTAKEEMTPLQQRLDQVGRTLAAAGAVVAVLIFVIGVARQEPLDDMLLTAISTAVAVVPEGLPAVVTFSLAIGAQRMLRRNALIRKLPAVETLGSVTTICSDKTGTLTENRMTVTVIDVAGHRLEITQEMRRGRPSLEQRDRDPAMLESHPLPIALVMAGGALCNDARLILDPQSGQLRTLGDPTEGALLVLAALGGLQKDELERLLPRVAELPFDSDRKRMTTVHRLPFEDRTLPAPLRGAHIGRAPYVAFTKGAMDGLLEISSSVWTNGQAEPLDATWRARIEQAGADLAQNGMRVLGFALCFLQDLPGRAELALERDLTFLGMVGIIDPPRPEVRQSVQVAKQAGIRIAMITGDHPLTAAAIARELTIGDGREVLTGKELERLSMAELRNLVDQVTVYARVSPEHKLKIVQALQELGHVVAMTGDGVNDAPALRKADIGVAMGLAGTDVSKEAADIVLLDDNFATIVGAVEEGRVIYDNIRRFVKFSIAGNLGKVLAMLLAPLGGINIALLPLQLLWLNLLTDGLLGVGMSREPAEPGTMQRPPRSPYAGIFADGVGRQIAWVGALSGVVALGVGFYYYAAGHPHWQTMIFTLFAVLQTGQALASRSDQEPFLGPQIFRNPLLLLLALLVLALQMAAVYAPGLQRFLETQPLSPTDLAVCLAFGSLVFLTLEFEKWRLRRAGAAPRV